MHTLSIKKRGFFLVNTLIIFKISFLTPSKTHHWVPNLPHFSSAHPNPLMTRGSAALAHHMRTRRPLPLTTRGSFFLQCAQVESGRELRDWRRALLFINLNDKLINKNKSLSMLTREKGVLLSRSLVTVRLVPWDSIRREGQARSF